MTLILLTLINHSIHVHFHNNKLPTHSVKQPFRNPLITNKQITIHVISDTTLGHSPHLSESRNCHSRAQSPPAHSHPSALSHLPVRDYTPCTSNSSAASPWCLQSTPHTHAPPRPSADTSSRSPRCCEQDTLPRTDRIQPDSSSRSQRQTARPRTRRPPMPES